MIGKDDVLRCAITEYHAEVPTEDADGRMARRSAVRGMMVRLGLYGDFVSAILQEAERSGGEASVLVLASLLSEIRGQLRDTDPSVPKFQDDLEELLECGQLVAETAPKCGDIPGGDCRVDKRATRLATLARDLRLCVEATEGAVPAETGARVRSVADELVAMAVLFQSQGG